MTRHGRYLLPATESAVRALKPTRTPWCRWANETTGPDAEGWHAHCHRHHRGRCPCSCHGDTPRARAKRGGEPGMAGRW